MMNKAIFLDRDGTINVDKDYVHKIEDLDFEKNAVIGLKKMQQMGFELIIITNQSGIGRDYYTEEDYNNLMQEIYARLEEKDISIDAAYYCPHAPKENCPCRKPNTGMIDKAVKENNIDISKSYFIGDKTTDVLAGKNAGLKTILLKTGKAGKDGKYEVSADYVCKDLVDAAQIISASK